MKNSRITKVEESDFGVYLWKLPSGEYLGNEDGDPLNIPSVRHDLSKMAKLRQAAAYYGYPEGEAIFFSGHRRVTDEEYEEQKDRMAAGLTPDIYDAPALIDELNYKKEFGNG